MASYLAPGVYVEEVSFRAPSIEGVGTTTTGFVGPTLTGPVGSVPDLLTSFGDFQNIYGGYDQLSIDTANAADLKNMNYLALSVKAFFDNGGSVLYVSRVFAGGSAASAANSAKAGSGDVTINARFPGAFANNQTVTVSLVGTKVQNVANLPPGSLVAVVNPNPGTTNIGTVKVEVDVTTPPTTQVTLNAALTGNPPSTVVIDGETLTVTGIDATNTILSVSPVTRVHLQNTPVSATLPVATLYANATGHSFLNGATPLPSPIPAGTSLYGFTLRVSAFSAASQKVATTGSQEVQTHDGLGFDPAHPNYVGTMLGATPPRHIDELQNQIAFTLAPNLSGSALFTDLFGSYANPAVGASKTYILAGGNDGGEPVSGDYDTALHVMEGLEDIAIVAAPGSSIFTQSHAIVDSLITHVSRQRAYRVAILDTPPNNIASDYEDVRARIDTSYAALYVPWIVMSNPLARSGTAIPAQVAVPPSGFVAGIYARSDDQHSVAKAPANEVVLDALDLERMITFGEQATLNPLGINCVRYFPDRGYRVWGARTASSDSEFHYINVRRYLVYLEHSIDNSTQWAVFENNGPALWARVKDSIDSFLYNEFVERNLLGNSPSEAYFVRCDRTTMTQNDLDQGRMICLIGVAVLKPAEKVIFRIGQTTSSARS